MTKYIYDQLNLKEHRVCPNCGKLMIKRVSTEIDDVIDGLPAKEWWWHCGCGAKETGGVLKGVPELEYLKREWERVNNIEKDNNTE